MLTQGDESSYIFINQTKPESAEACNPVPDFLAFL